MLTDEALEQFRNANAWIRLMSQIQSINQKNSSYGLKHTVERYQKIYIANGILIAAALDAGYRYKLCSQDSPNCWFNMSQKSIKQYDA